VRARFAAPLAALLITVGCSGPDPKDTQTGYPNGFETEIKVAVQFKNPANDKDASLVSAVDTAVAKTIETDRDKILDVSLAEYEKERGEEGTKISKDVVEVVAEDYQLTAEDAAATRKLYEGKTTRFRFTLRRPKARLAPDPQRIEVVLSCVERSWAPGDTLRFAQIFRAALMDQLNEAVYTVAADHKLEPTKPRKVRTQ
jgi:hypothetical protein